MRFPRIGRPSRRAWTTIGSGGVAFVCLVAVLLSNLVIHANGGVPPAPSNHVRDIVLSDVVPRALSHAHLIGREDETRQLSLSISLRLRNAQALSALITAQQNPQSPQYHKYLTPQTFTDTFGPTSASVAAVRSFLQAAGLDVTSISSNRMLINATGTVAQAEKAFGVTIGRYQLGKRTVYGPEQSPVVPHALTTTILNIGGLDDVGQMRPLLARALTAPHVVNPSPIGGYAPTDLRNAYDVTSLITNGGDGTGQRVGVVEFAPFLSSDVATYRSQYSLPSATINGIGLDHTLPIFDGPGTIEADLDIEVVSALAPNATQDVYVAPNSWQGVNDLYTRIVSDNNDHVITSSWGLCEPYTGAAELQTLHGLFSQAALQGQTVFAAAGDSGSDDCGVFSGYTPNVDSPASDPYVVGVGGTSLTLSGGGYGSETTWNDGLTGGGGGGGMSGFFSRPSWQLGANMPNTFTQRLVPDVAADADPNTGYSMYCTSYWDCTDSSNTAYGWLVVGGTSAAAPLWAGMLADINTYLANNSVATTGWVNQTLYVLAANAQTNTPFHDVTQGTNDIDYSKTPYAGDYPAGPCYDTVTGSGTPDAWNIARDIQGGVQTGGAGPCPLPANTVVGPVQDGGFENTPSGWKQYSLRGDHVIAPDNPHNGNLSFVACAYPNCDDRAWQLIDVPNPVQSATLTFWLDGANLPNIASPGSPCLDRFTVTLAKPDGTVFDTVQALCTLNTQGYVLESFDLTSVLQQHQGQFVILMFRGTTANVTPFPGYYSFWCVDDVSLSVSIT